MSLLRTITRKGKALSRSLALATSLLSPPAYAQSLSTENAPERHREISLSFSNDNNPSLEPMMLVNNAHTLESLLNEGLWSLHPSTFIGRGAILGAGFYGQAIVSTLPHEFSHHQESREAGKKNIQLHFERIITLQPYGQYDPKRGNVALRDDLVIIGRGPTLNTLLAADIVTESISLRHIHALDSVAYLVNHTYISTPVLDKLIYKDLAQKLHGEKTAAYQDIERDALGVSIFNALDPYALYSLWSVGKYLLNGNPVQALPPPFVPQLNGYLAFPQPLYEASWYVPWKESVVSAALRGGKAVENYAALRIGLQHVSWKGVQFKGLVEGIENEGFGIAAHASILFPFAGIKVGPTFSYKSEGVWTPFMNGLSERIVGGFAVGF